MLKAQSSHKTYLPPKKKHTQKHFLLAIRLPCMFPDSGTSESMAAFESVFALDGSFKGPLCTNHSSTYSSLTISLVSTHIPSLFQISSNFTGMLLKAMPWISAFFKHKISICLKHCLFCPTYIWKQINHNSSFNTLSWTMWYFKQTGYICLSPSFIFYKIEITYPRTI